MSYSLHCIYQAAHRVSYLGWLLLASLCLSDCHSTTTSPTPSFHGTVCYIQSDFPYPAENQIGAYVQQADGSLVELPGSPFNTLGQGAANTDPTPGQEESDESLALSLNKKRLFAVNQGDNTISVFDIRADGTLTLVPGAPFPSGGSHPCSIGVAGNYIYVVNKGEYVWYKSASSPQLPSSYAVFAVSPSGQLTPVPNSTITTTFGALPTHAYVAPGRHLLFVDDTHAFQAPSPGGTLRAFAIGTDGRLSAAPGTPATLPLLPPATVTGGALGLWGHPTQPLLYVGMPVQNKLGVYRYDPVTGTPTFVQAVEAGFVRQLRTNQAGTRLYALNSAANSVNVFDITQPQTPVFMQQLVLRREDK